MLWRALGSYDSNGSWVAPVSFLEAQQLPKDMLDIFMRLDDIVDRMQTQKAKKAGS